jgi:hypothetical protein
MRANRAGASSTAATGAAAARSCRASRPKPPTPSAARACVPNVRVSLSEYLLFRVHLHSPPGGCVSWRCSRLLTDS